MTEAIPFITHTAQEVAGLSDAQIRILWQGAHQWIADGANAVKGGRAQLQAVEAEMRRRGMTIAHPT